MKKTVLAPDSFKGTMSAIEICSIMEEQIRRHYPETAVVSIPVADGGEGTVDCFLRAVGGEKVLLRAKGPRMEEIDAFYGLLQDGTAVVEMAACAGLLLMKDRLDPLNATTYGVGQLILHAAHSRRSGAPLKGIVVGLGGSATTDGGCGLASAIGVKFYNSDNQPFIPTGGTLRDICRIDMSGLDPAVKTVPIMAMCDIDNPLYGPLGAAYVFAPQKGASPEDVSLLDSGLRHLAEVIRRDIGVDVSALPGGGAAGGLGAGMAAFLGAELRMGIEIVLDTVGFEDVIQGADLILTGEGKIDTQSLRGKVVIGVARRAASSGVPVVAVVGDIDDGAEEAYGKGIAAIFSINRKAINFGKARLRSKSDLALTVDNLMRFLRLFR